MGSSQTCWFRQQGLLGVGDRQFVDRAEVVHGEGKRGTNIIYHLKEVAVQVVGGTLTCEKHGR